MSGSKRCKIIPCSRRWSALFGMFILFALVFPVSFGCTFDSSALEELRRRSDTVEDIGGDLQPDDPVVDPTPEPVDDAADVLPDPVEEPTDVIEDPVEVTDLADIPEEVVDVVDVIEDPTDVVDVVEDPLDVIDVIEDPLDVLDVIEDPLDVIDVIEDPLDVVDVVEDPVPDVTDPVEEEPVNQPPVLTLPADPQVEENQVLTITGISVTDPDVGALLMEASLSASHGEMTLGTIPGDLVFPQGDGVSDTGMTFEGDLTDLNTALGSIDFISDTRGDNLIDLTVSDLGHTGTGGAQSDSGTITVDVIERQYDFTVQHGGFIMAQNATYFTMVAGSGYQAPEDPSRAIIRLVNTRLTGEGRTDGGGKQASNLWMVWIDDSEGLDTSVTFRRYAQQQYHNCGITWEIIEYTGEAGGPNEIIVHDTGTLVYGAEDLTVNSPSVTGITDDDDVVVFITGQAVNDSGRGSVHAGLNTAEWLVDGEDHYARFTRAVHQDIEATVSYAIVEFVGSNWSVQRIEHAFTNPGEEETMTIGGVGDVSRAFTHVQFRTNASKIDDLGGEVWLSSAVELTGRIESSSSASITAVAWIVANSQDDEMAMVVGHYSGANGNGGDDEQTWYETISPVEGLDRASVIGECARSSGNDDSIPQGSIVLELTDVDEVELRQSDNNNVQTYRFSAVQWPDSPPL